MSSSTFGTPGVLIISIDGLGARWLGAYGNTSMQTPAFDRLAARSLLFETALCRRPSNQPADWNWDRLLDQLRDRTDQTTLVTDCAVCAQWGHAGFEEVVHIELPQSTEQASSVEETLTGRFFAGALEAIESLRDGGLVMLHTSALFREWDAPHELRLELCGDEDPEPVSDIHFEPSIPDETATHDQPDPDLMWQWQTAYNAQLALIDECLDVIMSSLEQLPHTPMVILTAPRAFPLGEHGQFGAPESSLYDESIHVPLLIQVPDHLQPVRCQELVYADAWIDWCLRHLDGELQPPVPVLPDRQTYLGVRGSGQSLAIRTHAWKWIQKPDQSGQLFLKPDDRMEMNDVSDRCSNVVLEFDELKASIESEQTPTLSDLLAIGLD
ncbi:MAG: hypothetical protein R3C03_06990 [Pirellulaceae bacterium]